MVSVGNPNHSSVEAGAEDDKKVRVVCIGYKLPGEGSIATEKDLKARILCGGYGDVAIRYYQFLRNWGTIRWLESEMQRSSHECNCEKYRYGHVVSWMMINHDLL